MDSIKLSHRFHIDLPLLFSLLLLSGLGLFIVYSAADKNIDVVYRQIIKLGIAFIFMIAIAQFSPAQYQRWAIGLYIFGVLLLILVLIFGDVGKGAQRWLDVKLFRFQPSEFMKLALPIMIASYLAEETLPPRISRLFIVSILIIIPVVLIVKQPDLGTAILVLASGLAIIFIAGIRWKLLGLFTIIAACCAPILWSVMHDYQKRRVLTFINPENDPLGAGYHIIQSKIAIGSGGVYGKGWLQGTQSHLEFLPERSTDFIFAVLSEEFGLIGIIILVSLYLIILMRSFYIAFNAQQPFSRLLAGGLALTFFFYIFVNIGMVSGQLPVVGVPLPLISLGGTSMVTLMAGFGILMSIHTHRRFLVF